MRNIRRYLAGLMILLIAFSAWGTAEDFIYEEWEPLARGAKGEAVELLQEQLIDLGYLNGTADGSFGPATEAALQAFQRTAGLEVTGIADADTMELLLDPAAPVPTYAPTPSPQQSSEMVWIPRTGQRYHRKQTCSNMKNPSYVTKEEAIRLGYTPCKKCYK